jgi:hypothetical protein
MAPLAALCMLLFSGACSTIDTATPLLPAGRTVGIISAVGDEFSFNTAGLTGLDQHESRLPIEGWGIDDLIISRASEMLTKHFQVQSVNYRREDFAVVENTSSISVMNLLREDPLKKLVQTGVSPQGLDAYVAITKSKVTYGSRGRTVSGLGIIKYGMVFGSLTLVHALYSITVIDGHDFHIIGKRSASPPSVNGTLRLAGPNRSVDEALLPATDGPLQNEKLRAIVVDLIDGSLPSLLQDVRIVNGSLAKIR